MRSVNSRAPRTYEVVGHPLRARDLIEMGTFVRDLAWADHFSIEGEDRADFLSARAKSRRDLLWFCQTMLGLTRLTEETHRAPANFTMRICTTPHGFGNNRDPRGNGKTSLATIGGSLWCVIQDPIECVERDWPIRGCESRLGINTLKDEFTENFMQLVLDYLESPDLEAIFPDIYPAKYKRWGVSKGVDLRRGLPIQLRNHPAFLKYPPLSKYIDPSIAPGSLTSGRASAHTNGEFIDDPVNEKTWDSEPNHRRALHGIDQLHNICRPERGFRLVTGNHWSPGDVNSTFDERGAWEVFMRSATACEQCKDGYPVNDRGIVPKKPNGRWEHEHIGKTFVNMMVESDGKTPDLGRIRGKCGSVHEYLAQYENDPVSPEATFWTRDRFPTFDIIEYRGQGGLNPKCLVKFPDPKRLDLPFESRYQVCRISDLEITLTFDPSAGGMGPQSSRAAMTILGRTPADNFLWLASIAKRDDPLTMLDTLIEQVIFWHVRRIGVESVAYQRVIKPFLIREFRERKISWLSWDDDVIAIPATSADDPKKMRIRDSLNPLINGQMLLVNANTPGFDDAMLEVEGFPIRKPWDILDSLAMHPHLWRGAPPLSITRRKELRIQQLVKKRDLARTGTAYGWGKG